MKLKSVAFIAALSAVSAVLISLTGCREYGGMHPGYGNYGGNQYSGTIQPRPHHHHPRRGFVPPPSGGNQYSGTITPPPSPPGGTHPGYGSNNPGGNQYNGSIGPTPAPQPPVQGGNQYSN